MMGVILKKKKILQGDFKYLFMLEMRMYFVEDSDKIITKTHNGGSLFLKHKTTINAKYIIDFKSIAFEKMLSLL